MSEAEVALRADAPSAGGCATAFHLLTQGAAPDAPGSRPVTTRPPGLAAWLVNKSRGWSDCDGEVERRFTKGRL